MKDSLNNLKENSFQMIMSTVPRVNPQASVKVAPTAAPRPVTASTVAPTTQLTSRPVAVASTPNLETRMPHNETLEKAARFALQAQNCPPICFDYWRPSFVRGQGGACIGIHKTADGKVHKRLILNVKEFTSPIVSTFKGWIPPTNAPKDMSGGDIFIATENSIYLVSSDITSKAIDFSKLETD